jgi:hypothetical protein
MIGAHPDMPMFGDRIKVKGMQRRCGPCTMCCTHVPVSLPPPVGEKPAGVPCPHLSDHRRCGIYASRPRVCMAWSCRWLFDPDTSGLQRPDQGGYIISPDLQAFTINEQPMLSLQIWLDPARPDAHRDPTLRAYLLKIWQRHGIPASVRTTNREGESAMLLIPPTKPGEEWIEEQSNMVSQEEMDAAIARVQHE